MSTYTLNFTTFGTLELPGYHEWASIHVDGIFVAGHASAMLAPEGRDGRPGCCNVFVPLTVMLDGNLATDYAPHLFGTAEDGTRNYTFGTRDAALTFLRRIYNIDGPQPSLEAKAASTAVQGAPCGFELTFTVPHHDPEDNDYFFEAIFEAPRDRGLDGFPMPFSPHLYDVSTVWGIDDVGWCIHLGSLVTLDHLEGFTFQGVTVRTNTINGRTLVAEGFTTLNACKGFLAFVYECLYQSLRQTPQPEPQESPGSQAIHTQPDPASPCRLPVPLARDVIHTPSPLAAGRLIGPFFGNSAYPHPHQRNTQ